MCAAELAGTILDYRHLRGESLHGFLARVIEALADPAVAAALAAEIGDTWRLELCPDEPASAVISWQDSAGAIHSETFAPEQGNLPLDTRRYAAPDGARRVVVLPFAVLVAAGQLYARTRDRSASQESSPTAPGNAGANDAEPGTKNAAGTGIRDGVHDLGQPAEAIVLRTEDISLTSRILSTTGRTGLQADLHLTGDRYDRRTVDREHAASS